MCIRDSLIPVSNTVKARDSRGRVWEFEGVSVGGAPWYSWNPFTCSFSSLMEYHAADGRVGHAMMTDVYGLEFLAQRLSRRCLLYTSDAADERSSVDLGGRRIIKKKKKYDKKGSKENTTQTISKSR